MGQVSLEQTCLKQTNTAISELARSPLFKSDPRTLSSVERNKLCYRRAKAFCNAYGLNISDIVYMTPKFCKMNLQPLAGLDIGTLNLLSIQTNLFIGTLGPFAVNRPELNSILQAAMNFEISAQYMLTELNHGLDTRNLQTTATILPDGDIDLHTPSPGDAKAMPPTTTRSGLPVVAIVMARLVYKDKDCGIKPFLVELGDGEQMCENITARALPTRTGAHPVDHALTYFNHVRLPQSSLLGSIEKATDERESFLSTIHRISVGTLLVSGSIVPCLKIVAFVMNRYSRNRSVTGADGRPMAVIGFRTQSLPILHAVAQYSVLEAFLASATASYLDNNMDPRVRHGIATAFKAVAVNHFDKTTKAMSERCGWHGHYAHNQILQLELEMRGAATAEGDIRVLVIRLASELLIGRYQLPPPRRPTSSIARHEASLFAEAKALFQRSSNGNHRSENFNRDILPLALPLVEAIGHRMAYEAAQEANVDPKVIQLYETGVIKLDSAWYAEKGGISRENQREVESQAADALLPHLEDIMEESGMQDYCNAPMSSRNLMDQFIDGLELFEGNAKPSLLARL
ncbi:Acyl-CoA dehydrogenase/oxidase [Penicillium nucicola]|uniref:Acyl-CoA dehydrogenase/oxidase n=1 Tax=Penicillium nucicola TaxID=1850975 RepID=UPI002544EE68|nr:Acyl-CoA dehydrogenase/oxidase [Penicillium nucicola]KAJ5770409.1 Acyl-CoA dehydrogenase/oxidase [Penicillium nucicola]